MNNELVALVADVHFGYGNPVFLESQIKFFKEVLIPYCKKRKIKKIIQFGDLFENRRHLDIYVKNVVFDLFENDLKDFDIYIYLGNHDVYYKNSNEIHSLKFLSKFKNVKVIDKIIELKVYNRNFLFVPWLYDISLFKNYVNDNDISEIDVCFGHFDTIGSKMSKKSVSKNGLTKEFLFQFKKVFSGHYHSRSIEKRDDREIIYTGMPYQLNRGDEGEPRGFCVLNCKDLNYEFIENEISIKYVSLKFPEAYDRSQIKGNIVDVYITNNGNLDVDVVQKYVDEVNKCEPIQEPTKRFIDQISTIDVQDIKVKNLKEMFDEYIEHLNIDDEIKESVIENIASLYEECQKDF